MSTVIYEGSILNGRHTVEVLADGKRKPLNPRTDLAQHSPTGYCWGPAGLGRAQLALGLLAFHLDRFADDRRLAAKAAGYPEEARDRTADALAVRLHQRFKAACVARLNQQAGFRLSDLDVRRALRSLAGEDEPPQQALPGVA